MPEPDVKHESARINPRPILWAGGLLLAAAVLIHFALIGLQGYLQRQDIVRARSDANPLGEQRAAEGTNAQLAAVPPPRLEGLERLQGGAPTDHTGGPARVGNSPQFHPEDLAPAVWPDLNGYAWVDRDKAVARIPIDQAMAALLKSNRLKVQPGRENDRPPAPGAERMRSASSGRKPGEGPP